MKPCGADSYEKVPQLVKSREPMRAYNDITGYEHKWRASMSSGQRLIENLGFRSILPQQLSDLMPMLRRIGRSSGRNMNGFVAFGVLGLTARRAFDYRPN